MIELYRAFNLGGNLVYFKSIMTPKISLASCVLLFSLSSFKTFAHTIFQACLSVSLVLNYNPDLCYQLW